MTFYEAALRVLEREGKPLHVGAITEFALKENLLSHVGKSPDEVMQLRLLAMARRRADRRIVATAPLTYALAEWGIPEDPVALAAAPAEPPQDEKPLRPRERHPLPSPDKVRVAGRSDRPRKSRQEQDEERRKRRRFPPLAEVAFEILSEAGTSLAAVDIASAAREKNLIGEDLGAEALLHALREDNRRRAEAGRKVAFSITADGVITLEKVPAEARPEVPEARREEHRGPGASRIIAQASEHRRQIIRLVRRRLSELEAGGFEKAGITLLEQNGYRDIRVAKRGRDGSLFVTRKREGLLDLRCVVRMRRGAEEVTREDLEALRKDMAQNAGHLGIVLCPGDANRDARQDAQIAGQPLVILLCGDALAERCLEKQIGTSVTTVEVYDLDEEFFRRCRERGREDDRERRRERDEQERLAAQAPAGQAAPQASAPAADAGPTPARPPSTSERERDAAALAERMVNGPVPDGKEELERRRAEEARQRIEAHERIEAAELAARAKGTGATA